MNILLRLVLIVLTAIAVALYARVVLPPEKVARDQSAGAASTVEAGDGPPSAAARALMPLPEEQMRQVLQVLAPELEAGDTMSDDQGRAPHTD